MSAPKNQVLNDLTSLFNNTEFNSAVVPQLTALDAAFCSSLFSNSMEIDEENKGCSEAGAIDAIEQQRREALEEKYKRVQRCAFENRRANVRIMRHHRSEELRNKPYRGVSPFKIN